MKYIKHIILTAFAMVVMMGAWAQTAPTPQSNGTWQFTMPDANKLLEVEYNPCVLTLTPGVNGSVAITLPTEGVTDNGDGTYNVMPGTEVTVTATANEHYLFVNWTNENDDVIEGDATKTFIVTGDTTLTASFALKTFKLTLYSNYDNMGDVVASATSGLVYNNNSTYTIDTGTVVTLTANANTSDHYHFVNWTDKYSTAIGTSAQMQFTITKDTNITGNFAIDTFEVSFGPVAGTQAAADANGSVDFDGDVPSGVVQKVEDNYLVPGTYKVPYNTTLNFAASPDLYYHVTGWSGATQSPTDSSKATLTVTEAKTVSATFAIDTVRLDSVRTTWNVYINGATTAIQSTRYSATDTMGYVKIPVNADVVITPQPEARAVRVSKLELIEPAAAPSASPVSEATTEDIGKIIGADGNIYADVASAVAAGTTANAIIAYVGSETGESGYTHGLAISMKDADIDAVYGGYDWASDWNANTTQLNTNYYEDLSAALAAKESGLTITNSKLADANPATNFPAFYAVGNNRITTTSDIGADVPIGTSNWFMPSIFQWQQILQGLSGETAALEENPNSKYTGTYINGRITNLSSSDYALASENPYWSSSESYRNLGLPQYFPWHYDPASSAGWAGKHIAKTVNMPVRAVIAF